MNSETVSDNAEHTSPTAEEIARALLNRRYPPGYMMRVEAKELLDEYHTALRDAGLLAGGDSTDELIEQLLDAQNGGDLAVSRWYGKTYICSDTGAVRGVGATLHDALVAARASARPKEG